MILFMTTVTVTNPYGITMELIEDDAKRFQIIEKFADDDITVIIDDVYDEIRFISKGDPVPFQFFGKSLHVGVQRMENPCQNYENRDNTYRRK